MSLSEISKTIFHFLRSKQAPEKCDAAVILGSGLGGFEQQLKNRISFKYNEIPGFPTTTVAGHSGSLHFGTIGSKSVIVFAGRFHRYEGHAFSTTVIPVQLAALFGCKQLYVSNAAGGINSRFQVGDLMIIDSLLSPNVKLSDVKQRWFNRYDPKKMVQKAREKALELNLHLQQGTYLYVTGSNYESKAEIRAYRIIGADAVGMSTAAELSEACGLGIDCLGISLITNMATGVSKAKLDHSEVKDVAGQRTEVFRNLIEHLITSY